MFVQGDPPVTSKVTDGILACYELRRFWISWIDGVIAVGTGGDIYNNRLLEWEDPNFHDILSVGLTSYRVPAEWRVSVIDGKQIYIFFNKGMIMKKCL